MPATSKKQESSEPTLPIPGDVRLAADDASDSGDQTPALPPVDHPETYYESDAWKACTEFTRTNAFETSGFPSAVTSHESYTEGVSVVIKVDITQRLKATDADPSAASVTHYSAWYVGSTDLIAAATQVGLYEAGSDTSLPEASWFTVNLARIEVGTRRHCVFTVLMDEPITFLDVDEEVAPYERDVRATRTRPDGGVAHWRVVYAYNFPELNHFAGYDWQTMLGELNLDLDLPFSVSRLEIKSESQIERAHTSKMVYADDASLVMPKDYSLRFDWTEDKSSYTTSVMSNGVVNFVSNGSQVVEALNTNGQYVELTPALQHLKGTPPSVAPEQAMIGRTITSKHYVVNDYDSSAGTGLSASIKIVSAQSADGHVNINLKFGVVEENFEDVNDETVGDETVLEYLESLGDGIEAEINCSIYDLQKISEEVQNIGVTTDLEVDLTTDEAYEKLVDLNKNYAHMIEVYQEMRANLGAKVTVDDSLLREKWLKQYAVLTNNMRFMRKLVMDITGAYKLENRLSVTFWRKLHEMINKSADKVERQLDILFTKGEGDGGCNERVVAEIVGRVTSIQQSYSALSSLKQGGTTTISDVANVASGNVENIKEISEIKTLNDQTSARIDTLKARMAELYKFRGVRVTVSGKEKVVDGTAASGQPSIST